MNRLGNFLSSLADKQYKRSLQLRHLGNFMDKSAVWLISYSRQNIVLRLYDPSCVMIKQHPVDSEKVWNYDFCPTQIVLRIAILREHCELLLSRSV